MLDEAKRRAAACHRLAAGRAEWNHKLHQRVRACSDEELSSDQDFLLLVRRLEELDAAERALDEAVRKLDADGVVVAEIAEALGVSARTLYVVTGALSCAFCAREEAQVARLVRGPEVDVCDRCAALAAAVVAGNPSAGNVWTTFYRSEHEGDRCSFCGKDSQQAGVLAGARCSRICADCVAFAMEVVNQETAHG